MQMKIHLTLILLLLAAWTYTYGQDGSDIKYFKVEGIDSSLKGQAVHLDFYRRSFGGRTLDTVIIKIENQPIRFVESRKDNGFNNWFSEQSLESLDSMNGVRIKIVNWIVLAISKDSILVKPNFEFTFLKGTLFNDKPFQENYWFKKETIKEILVKSKPFGS